MHRLQIGALLQSRMLETGIRLPPGGVQAPVPATNCNIIPLNGSDRDQNQLLSGCDGNGVWKGTKVGSPNGS